MKHAFRRGSLLLETAAAALIVGTMLVLCAHALGWTLHERRSIDRRAVALQEAANMLDQLTSLPWSEITAEKLRESRLSPEAAAILSPASLDVSLHQPADDPTAKRIAVTLGWQSTNGTNAGPVRLTAWIFRRTEN